MTLMPSWNDTTIIQVYNRLYIYLSNEGNFEQSDKDRGRLGAWLFDVSLWILKKFRQRPPRLRTSILHLVKMDLSGMAGAEGLAGKGLSVWCKNHVSCDFSCVRLIDLLFKVRCGALFSTISSTWHLHCIRHSRVMLSCTPTHKDMVFLDSYNVFALRDVSPVSSKCWTF